MQVIFKKFRISYDEIISDLCPVRSPTPKTTHTETARIFRRSSTHLINFAILQMLSVQQLYRISTQYWDDKYNTESVSEEVSTKSVITDSCKFTWLIEHLPLFGTSFT
jgi:myosin-5